MLHQCQINCNVNQDCESRVIILNLKCLIKCKSECQTLLFTEIFVKRLSG